MKMNGTEVFDNFLDAVCIFSQSGKILFKNRAFLNVFGNIQDAEKFKKHFNFSLYFLKAENFENKTPIDLMLKSKENFHTICTYRNENDEYLSFYLYTFAFNNMKAAVFKDITLKDRLETAEKQYIKLKNSYEEKKEETAKFEKLKEQAQLQMLKMSIINRISLVIRETNDIETIISSALNEIHNLTGSFKTYFSEKAKKGFKIRYAAEGAKAAVNTFIEYEDDVLNSIKNKNITVSACIKEYKNASETISKGAKRIIIPVYDKAGLLGIIVTLTRQRFNEKENREILQSIAVQLSSAIVQADLIQELDKKNKKLSRTLQELENTQMQLINTEKTASIGRLAAGIAHEINTPLASIKANSEMMHKIINSDSLSKDRLEILKELNELDYSAVNRISGIVKSLKRYIRLDEAELQKSDINSELDLTLKLAAHEIKKNTKIIKNYGVLPRIKCHVNMINQVFMNLIVNACQSIDAEKEEGIIEIETSSDDRSLTVKIKDNGCGIPEKNQKNIFTAGFTSKQAGIGTGLGLSISKKIIEMHKGAISFTSKENEGSVFIVSLPVN